MLIDVDHKKYIVSSNGANVINQVGVKMQFKNGSSCLNFATLISPQMW